MQRNRIIPIVIDSKLHKVELSPAGALVRNDDDKESDFAIAFSAFMGARSSREHDSSNKLLQSAWNQESANIFNLDYLEMYKIQCRGHSDCPSPIQIEIAGELGQAPLGWVLSQRSHFGIGMVSLYHGAAFCENEHFGMCARRSNVTP